MVAIVAPLIYEIHKVVASMCHLSVPAQLAARLNIRNVFNLKLKPCGYYLSILDTQLRSMDRKLHFLVIYVSHIDDLIGLPRKHLHFKLRLVSQSDCKLRLCGQY